jgi:hypothetical protein
MRSNLIELNLREAVEQLSAIKPALSSSIERFAKDLEAENRRNQGQPRTGKRSKRRPGPPGGRVVAYRGGSPQRLKTRIPATVVQRLRMLEGGRSPAQALREAVERIPDAIRNRLRALRNGLANVQRRFQVGTRVVQAQFGSSRRGAPPIGTSNGDSLLSWLAIVAAVGIGLSGMVHEAGSLTRPFAPRGPDVSGPDDSVAILAQAIAYAEGYYSPGERDGRSLPHWLNNPGSLKKPALGAQNLPTWKDTGLVVFPNEQMGWDALKHQVGLMITGKSSIYDPSNSLLEVAEKYANGDLNWGKNVARNLGISPSCTLAEIAGTHPNCSGVAREPEIQLAENAHETAIQ